MKSQQLYHLIWMSRPLMQAAEACVERGLDGTDLTVRMRAVLEILQTVGESTVPDIAAKLEIKRQYVQLMVNETLAAGFTKQLANPRHKRSPLIALTEDGKALIEAVTKREMALMNTIGADLDNEDISAALKVVQTVTQKLKSQADKA